MREIPFPFSTRAEVDQDPQKKERNSGLSAIFPLISMSEIFSIFFLPFPLSFPISFAVMEFIFSFFSTAAAARDSRKR